MPLSAKGLWLRRDHRRGRAALARPTRATPGVGSTPTSDDVGALGAEPGDERGLEHRARAAGVAPDDERLLGAEHAHRGAAERGDELGGELDVGDAAHAVGAEAQRHGDAIAGARSALRVLRSLAGLLEAVLAPLLLARRRA